MRHSETAPEKWEVGLQSTSLESGKTSIQLNPDAAVGLWYLCLSFPAHDYVLT